MTTPLKVKPPNAPNFPWPLHGKHLWIMQGVNLSQMDKKSFAYAKLQEILI